MPIVDHNNAPEVPWRPNYRKWDIVQPGDGTTSTSMSYSIVGTGAGAPLHTHEADELIIVLKGSLEARLGDDVQNVGANHTIVVPPNVPHGFTNKSPEDAHIIGIFPVQDPFNHTTYLEGGPAQAHES